MTTDREAAGEGSSSFPGRVSVACHDLRTPLATVFGFARTLERQGGLDERQRRYLDMVIAGAKELIRLIDDLAVLARIEAGTFVPRREPADLRALAADAAAEATDRMQSSREVRGPGSGPPAGVVTDRKLTVGALASLAESALRFEPRRGAVGLDVAEDGSVHLGPLDEEAARMLERDAEDLRVVAARAVLAELGGRVEAEPDGISIAFAGSAAGGDPAAGEAAT